MQNCQPSILTWSPLISSVSHLCLSLLHIPLTSYLASTLTSHLSNFHTLIFLLFLNFLLCSFDLLPPFLSLTSSSLLPYPSSRPPHLLLKRPHSSPKPHFTPHYKNTLPTGTSVEFTTYTHTHTHTHTHTRKHPHLLHTHFVLGHKI